MSLTKAVRASLIPGVIFLGGTLISISDLVDVLLSSICRLPPPSQLWKVGWALRELSAKQHLVQIRRDYFRSSCFEVLILLSIYSRALAGSKPRASIYSRVWQLWPLAVGWSQRAVFLQEATALYCKNAAQDCTQFKQRQFKNYARAFIIATIGVSASGCKSEAINQAIRIPFSHCFFRRAFD